MHFRAIIFLLSIPSFLAYRTLGAPIFSRHTQFLATIEESFLNKPKCSLSASPGGECLSTPNSDHNLIEAANGLSGTLACRCDPCSQSCKAAEQEQLVPNLDGRPLLDADLSHIQAVDWFVDAARKRHSNLEAKKEETAVEKLERFPLPVLKDGPISIFDDWPIPTPKMQKRGHGPLLSCLLEPEVAGCEKTGREMTVEEALGEDESLPNF